MTNVLIEGYEHMPSYDLSVRDMIRFSRYIPISVRAKLTRQITADDIKWCDVLLTIRGNNPLSEYVAKATKTVGRKVVLTLDDDLMLYKSSHPYYDELFANSLRNVMEISDCVITTSHYLGEKYKKEYGIRYNYSDTPVEEKQIKKKKVFNPSSPVRIVYAAGPNHKVFFDKLITPILNRLWDRYREQISMTIIGPDVNLDNTHLRINKIPSMPMEQYRNYMLDNDFDIGIAPLFDSEFCKSKYFNKYIEYSMSRICGVYSNVMPYNLVIKDGYNGFLADNIPEAWYEKLCYVIDNRDIRESCKENSVQHLLTEHSLDYIAQKMFDDMNDIYTFKAKPIDRNVCKYMYLRYWLSSFRRVTKAYWHEHIVKDV